MNDQVGPRPQMDPLWFTVHDAQEVSSMMVAFRTDSPLLSSLLTWTFKIPFCTLQWLQMHTAFVGIVEKLPFNAENAGTSTMIDSMPFFVSSVATAPVEASRTN